MARAPQTLIGIATLAIAGVLGFGATQISSQAGYSGVGPDFLPWLVCGALLVCGGWLLWQARSGGFREMGQPPGAATGSWPGFAWVSAAVLVNAALITTVGFILSCTLCFVLAVRGFDSSGGRLNLSLRAWVVDAAVGAAIAAPVYWMFTQLLAVNLPGLTATGWL